MIGIAQTHASCGAMAATAEQAAAYSGPRNSQSLRSRTDSCCGWMPAMDYWQCCLPCPLRHKGFP